MGAIYAIPILYVPLLMITHIAAFYLLLRRQESGAATGMAAAEVELAGGAQEP